ncbi:MAG TPA: CPBP family intramembrane glutamic endopeptidase [Terriglobales bacterium]|nr:CPBP family intramembrane glutamic endopeptidase [Terriglobales bacterium]
MASESKSFVEQIPRASSPEVRPEDAARRRPASNLLSLFEVGLVFGLILAAVWTPLGGINFAVSLAAAALIIVLAFHAHSPDELGLVRPFSGALVTLAAGALLVFVIAAIGLLTRTVGPPQPLPWFRAWQYAIWALLQQFILQSFMYLRLESVVGGRRAVLTAAVLFSVAHIPNPWLVALSLVGALFFCETFRRYRNIFPLGLVHGALGLTIAASLPDRWLHHMRVGLGYLMYHA